VNVCFNKTPATRKYRYGNKVMYWVETDVEGQLSKSETSVLRDTATMDYNDESAEMDVSANLDLSFGSLGTLLLICWCLSVSVL
jgi:maltoporin